MIGTELIVIKQLYGSDRFRVTIKSDCLSKDKDMDRLLEFGRKIASCWMIDKAVIVLVKDMTETSEIRLYSKTSFSL